MLLPSQESQCSLMIIIESDVFKCPWALAWDSAVLRIHVHVHVHYMSKINEQLVLVYLSTTIRLSTLTPLSILLIGNVYVSTAHRGAVGCLEASTALASTVGHYRSLHTSGECKCQLCYDQLRVGRGVVIL